MKTISTLIRSLLLLLAWLSTLNSQLSTAHAQDTAFTYQGRLNDGANPASGIYDLRFTLYDAFTNGTAFGALTNVATRVSNGLFTTALDFGPDVFTGSNYWLEIAVRTNGGSAFATLAPRQPITPTPYALYAPSAGSAATATMAGSANSVAAANLTGTIADSHLSGNIPRLNIPNTNIQATANAVIVSGFIVDTTNLMGGVGYTSNPLVTVTDVSGSNAVITATVANGVVTSLTVQAAGLHYSAGATLTIAPPPSNAYQTFNSGNVFNGVSTFSTGTFGNFSGGTMTLSSNLNLPATTATAGIINSGGSTLLHTYGVQNFFAGVGAGNLKMTGVGQNVGIGFNALHSNTSGNQNTANGYTALTSNTTGTGNTAYGWGALFSNTSGSDNTADGLNTLAANTTGIQNSAIGRAALRSNTTGNYNTASGFNALWNNTTGSKNTASGYQTLLSNTNGVSNVANGYQALYANTSGNNNTANGDWALNLNTTGSNNTANGHQALNLNTTGSYNTADGDSALHNNTSGSNNIAVGFQAGLNLATGNNNIDIGHLGAAGESSTIRIGTAGIHSNTFISGVINGNGSGLANVSATTLSGLAPTNFWQTGGNSGTSPLNGNFLGTTDNQPLELKANNTTALHLESFSGTINVIAGYVAANSVLPGAFGATISGGGYAGSGNRAASFATVGGGYRNDALGALSTIGGGNFNTSDGVISTVGGGYTNRAGGQYAAVLGGSQNSAAGDNSFVGGGTNNLASGFEAVVAGGANNTASAVTAFVGGGYADTASGPSATVSGGGANTASGYAATIAGGWGNQAIGASSAIAGGTNNFAGGFGTTVSGGYQNASSGDYASIGGGNGNVGSAQYGTVGGGFQNTNSGFSTTVAGGNNNSSGGAGSTVGGGAYNTSSGNAATVPGGVSNMAAADGSFAAGSHAQATNKGAFVWSDGSGAVTTSTTNNSVTFRASGGYWLLTGTTNVGVSLAANGTAWATISDRNAKKNFAPVDGQDVLEKLARVPITHWNYKWESDTDVPHLGPMAQDFKAAFYPGRDDKTITTLEFDGVALAAIQGLNEKVEEQRAENAELKQRLERLERLLSAKIGGAR